MMDSVNGTSNPSRQGSGATPAARPGRLGLALGLIALVLFIVLAIVFYQSNQRLNEQVARLNRQMETLSRQLARQARQSQALSEAASQAAAKALAAAHERDLALQAQAKSAAQAQSALERAAVAQQQATQAELQAQKYRQEREAELDRLQQVLGQIAQTRRTALGLVMTLGSKDIRFDFNKANIKPQYRDILNRIAGVLMTLKGYSIYVYGYTDDIGTQAYNLKLSERRADAVRDFLVKAGISPSIITTKGFGKADPLVPGNSPQARAANRRVEIGLVDSSLRFENQPLPAK